MTDISITTLLTVSGIQTLAFALIAILLGWLLLRGLDRLSRVDFKLTMTRIAHEPHAAALYFGCRFVGVCLLLGMVLS
jgi:hypothetical protein